MEPVDTATAAELWAAYRAALPSQATDAEMPNVERFGDNPALSDALLGLVLAGAKRATATLVKDFEAEDDRSLATWLHGHRACWLRVCGALGIEWSDDLETLFGRFTVAWTAS